MASQAPQRMTLADFLVWDDGTDRRYQLVDGVLTMLAPATEAHGELVLSLGAEIRSRLRLPCRVISEAGITVPEYEILIVFPDERRVELHRRSADGWRVEDLIGQASIQLGICDGPIPLEALYRDLLEPVAPEAPSGA